VGFAEDSGVRSSDGDRVAAADDKGIDVGSAEDGSSVVARVGEADDDSDVGASDVILVG